MVAPLRLELSLASPAIEQGDYDLSVLLKDLSIERIRDDTIRLSSFESRVTGYNGCRAAAQYIAASFNKTFQGLDWARVEIQEYPVVVPIDYGASVTLHSGQVLPLYTLWPNLVQTCPIPPEGFEGKLVYAGRGSLHDLDNLDIEGNIILLEFNSGKNWLNLAKLKAKAVIFLDPGETSYVEARSKFLTSPVYFPRLYATGDVANQLRDLARNGTTVKINSRMVYETIWAQNVMGIIKGTGPFMSGAEDEVIVIASHYDTWSVVPRLAPGADEATGPASLLELARFFVKHRPRRSVWLVALSGHWQALAGAREWVESNFFKFDVATGKRRIWMFFNLDFSTDSDRVLITHAGYYYRYGHGGALKNYAWVQSKTWRYVEKLESDMNHKYRDTFLYYGLIDDTWWGHVPTTYMLDSEPFSVANGIGISFRTDDAYRLHWGHPYSTINKVRFENLRPQLEVSLGIIYGYLNEEDLKIKWDTVKPERVLLATVGAAGMVEIRGSVQTYDPARNWYSPVPNAIVVIMPFQSMETPFAYSYVFSDSKGQFTFRGAQASVTRRGEAVIGSYGYGGRGGELCDYVVYAFKLNWTTGDILYAPDQGTYGAMSFLPFITTSWYPTNATAVVFQSQAAALFDLIDPRGMDDLGVLDPRYDTYMQSVPASLEVYEAETLSPFISWGFWLSPAESVGMIFVPTGERFIALYKVGPAGNLAGALLNSSDNFPEGYGYILSGSHPSFNALEIIADLLKMSNSRYKTLRTYGVYDAIASKSLDIANRRFSEALTAMENKQYRKAYASTLLAWSSLMKGYESTMKTTRDVLNTAIFFFTLMIPFAILAERLIINAQSGKKQMLAIMAISITSILSLFFTHPGFHLAASIYGVFLGLIIAAVTLPVLLLLIYQSYDIAKKFRRKEVGFHFVEVGRMSTAAFSLPLGIQNMRRRRLRTIFLSITLITTTFSLIALTSAIPTTTIRQNVLASTPPYQGLLFKKGVVMPSQYSSDLVSQAAYGLGIPGTVTAPRAWYYPQSTRETGAMAYLRGPAGTYGVLAFLGLTPQERNLSERRRMIIDGSLIEGTWFIEDAYYACIITKSMSERLGVHFGDTVSWAGINLTVIGVVDPVTISGTVDLDGRQITPLDPTYLSALSPGLEAAGGEEMYVSLGFDQILLVPYRFARDIGAYVASTSISFKDEAAARRAAEELTLSVPNIQVYAGFENRTVSFGRALGIAAQGWVFAGPPLAIACLSIFITMLQGVHERVREISIYSSVGLNPFHIALMFLIESLEYAVMGGFIGYIIGISLNTLLINQGLLPEGFYPNYSSFFVIVATGFSMIATLISSIYPIKVAARVVTPSLVRKWTIPTKPVGRQWFIPTPFKMADAVEAKAALLFMEEYLKGHAEEGVGNFITNKVQTSFEEMTVTAEVFLAPYERGVRQKTTIHALFDKKEKQFFFEVILNHLYGERGDWILFNNTFLNDLRNQMLLWRGMHPEEKERYLEMVKDKNKT